jgi:hypothetical protein
MSSPKIVQRHLAQAEALAAAQHEAIQAAAPQNVVTDASQLLADPPPAPQPAPAPTSTPTPAPEPSENWEQKYRSVAGRMATELPPLRAQLKTYESELVALREQVSALSKAAQQQPKQQPKTIDPRDVEAFGQDMIDMVQRYAQQTFQALSDEFGSRAATLEGRVERLEGTVQGVSTKTEETMEKQFYTTLTKAVPDWREINESDAWLAWLTEVDPIYGFPRQDALNHAHGKWDVDRVAATFNQFKQSRPAKPSQALASQQAPSSTGAGNVTVQVVEPKQILSAKFVNKFYADQFKGRYRGREDEAARIEAQINQAAAEGRIAP